MAWNTNALILSYPCLHVGFKLAVDLMLLSRSPLNTYVTFAEPIDLILWGAFPTMGEQQIAVWKNQYAIIEREITEDETVLRLYEGVNSVWRALYSALNDEGGALNPIPPCRAREFSKRRA